MSFNHNPRKPGELIQAAEWNAMGAELARLEQDKVNREGDIIRGDLRVLGNLLVGNEKNPARLRLLAAPSEPGGEALMIGPPKGPGLRLGTYKGFTWIQAQENAPLAIAPLGGKVGIGTPDPDSTLTLQPQKGSVDWLSFRTSQGAPGWQLNNQGAGLNLSETGVADGRLFVAKGGNVGIGTLIPQAKLQVTGGAIMPAAGSDEKSGILFPKDPGAGLGDAAWIRYYARRGESTTLEIGISNDGDDHIALMPSGNVGIGTLEPMRKLHVENSEIHAGGASGGFSFSDRQKPYVEDGASGSRWVWYARDGIARLWSAGDRLTLDSAGALSVPRLNLTASEVYFTDVNHDHSGFGNTSGFAAIENAKNYECLMILGRTTAEGRKVKIWDDCHVDRKFTAGQKLFRIPHPLHTGSDLIHACLEGPENAVYYRGVAQLEEGRADVKLPDYFEALTRKEERTVHLTAIGPEAYPLSYTEIEDGAFVVFGDRASGRFAWEVKAVRADVESLVIEVPSEGNA